MALENGTVLPKNVGYIVDLCYVLSSEKQILKQDILLMNLAPLITNYFAESALNLNVKK